LSIESIKEREMEFPTEFPIKKIVLAVTPRMAMDAPPYYESSAMTFEVSGEQAGGWFGSGTGEDLTKEQYLEAAVEGLKVMAAKLAEYSTRDDVYLYENSISVTFYGDASDSTSFDLTPEEEEIVE
jgi:hypothetical protein